MVSRGKGQLIGTRWCHWGFVPQSVSGDLWSCTYLGKRNKSVNVHRWWLKFGSCYLAMLRWSDTDIQSEGTKVSRTGHATSLPSNLVLAATTRDHAYFLSPSTLRIYGLSSPLPRSRTTMEQKQYGQQNKSQLLISPI